MSNWPIEYTPDHADKAIARLTSFYSKAFRLKDLIRLEIKPLQDLEDVAYDLLTQRWIFSAVGTQLDKLGELVGEPRNGRGADVYRDQINVRIGFNLSGGQPEQIINLVSILTNANSVQLREYYPAAVTVRTDGDTIPQRLHKSIRGLVPAGVSLQLISLGVGTAFSFDAGQDTGGFDSAPNWTPPDLYPAFAMGADSFTLSGNFEGFGVDGDTAGGAFWGSDFVEENVTRTNDIGELVAVAIVN